MQSRTKSKVEIQDVENIVCRHFPEEEITRVEELTEGLFNRAYLVTGTGALQKGVVLKIGTSPDIKVLSAEENIMRTEIAVYQMLERTEVLIPRIYAVDTSRSIIDCDYFIMEKLEGVTWKSAQNQLAGEAKERLLEKLGELTAKLHKIKGGHFGYINRKETEQFSSWGAAFAKIVEGYLADCKGFGFILPYERIEKILADNMSLLDEIIEPCLVDNDLFGNCFLSPKLDEIVGTVDFERCLFADPFMDFTSCLTLFDDVEKAPAYLRGYEKEMGKKLVITSHDRKRMTLYYLQKAIAGFAEGYRYEEEFRQKVQGYMKMRMEALLKKVE